MSVLVLGLRLCIANVIEEILSCCITASNFNANSQHGIWQSFAFQVTVMSLAGEIQVDCSTIARAHMTELQALLH